MDYGIAGLAQGLNQSINQYLGLATEKMQNDYKQANALQAEKAKIDYTQDAEYKRQSLLQNDELKRQMALEDHKHSLLGHVDESTADGIVPGAGGSVTAFKTANGRYPTVEEATSLFGKMPKAQPGATHLTDPQTLASLAKLSGAPDETVAGFASLKTPIATGLAEQALKNTFEKGLTDSALLKFYQELNPGAIGKDPSALGEDFQKFKVAFTEPGKETLSNDADFTKAADALDKTVMVAYQKTGSLDKALTLSAGAISKFDRKTKARLLFRATADFKSNQQSQQAQAPQPQQ